jgi:hypothetical protein
MHRRTKGVSGAAALAQAVAKECQIVNTAAELHAKTLPDGPERERILRAVSLNGTFLALAVRLLSEVKPKKLAEQARLLQLQGLMQAQDE